MIRILSVRSTENQKYQAEPVGSMSTVHFGIREFRDQRILGSENSGIREFWDQATPGSGSSGISLIQRRAIVIEYNIAQPSNSVSTTGLASSNHPGMRDGARI